MGAMGIKNMAGVTLMWDDTRTITIDGEQRVRSRLLIRKEHVPFSMPGLGPIRHTDVGRTIVVDRMPDGREVDTMASPGSNEAIPFLPESTEPTPLGTLCAELGITATAQRILKRADGGGAGSAKHWMVKLEFEGRSLFVGFSGGVATHDPRVDDVLSSLCSDAAAADVTFEDWCGDFGYDTDSRSAEGLYRMCAEQRPRLLSLLGKHFDAVREAARDQ